MPAFRVIFKYQEGRDVSLSSQIALGSCNTVIIVNSYHAPGTVLNTPCVLSYLVLTTQ